MKTIVSHNNELQEKFEVLFKEYEAAGSSHVSFEDLQAIFKKIKELKLKIDVVSGEYNQQQ